MSIFDIAIFSIIIISALLGCYRGITSIIINFIGLLASIVFAIFIFPYIEVFIIPYIDNGLISNVVTGVISYFISLILFTLICTKIVDSLSFVSKGPIDRTLGLLFGALRGVIISMFIYIGYAVLATSSYSKAKVAEEMITKIDDKNYPQLLKDSISTGFLQKVSIKAVEVTPKSVFRKIDSISTDKTNTEEIEQIKQEKE